MMVAPVLGLRGNGGDPLRSTNRGRTIVISGSRPYANQTAGSYRESAASLGSDLIRSPHRQLGGSPLIQQMKTNAQDAVPTPSAKAAGLSDGRATTLTAANARK
jgi:hypothetical protein